MRKRVVIDAILSAVGLRVWALIGALIMLAAGAGAALWFQTPEQTPGGPPFSRVVKPKAVPQILFQDAGGRARSLEEFRGKLILLNIWATWCAPCREEMPALDRLQARLGGRGFEVVALSIDTQGPQAVRKFFDQVGVRTLELYIDPSAQASFKLAAVGLPTTLMIDREGREIGRHVGPANWDAPEIVDDLARRLKDER